MSKPVPANRYLIIACVSSQQAHFKIIIIIINEHFVLFHQLYLAELCLLCGVAS